MNEQAPKTNHKLARRTGVLVLIAGAFGAGVVFHEPLMRLMSPPAKAADTKDAAGQQLWTCSMHPQVILDHSGFCPICHMALTPLSAGTHAAAHSHGPTVANAVVIDPVVVQRMGVRIATAEMRKLTRMIRLVGEITEPEPNHTEVNLRVNGWIDKLYADADGKEVKEGDPLFDIYSPELSVAVDELIAARKQQATSAESNQFFQATMLKLQRMGLNGQQIMELSKLEAAPRTISILSPKSGHVTMKTVVAGSAVKAGDPALRIADRSSMWVELQVFEQDLPFIAIGQAVSINTPASSNKTLTGQISFIYPHLDMMTRTARVRIVIPNTDHSLHEGMYATADVEAVLADDTIVIPREAVIDTGTRQMTFLSLGDGKFEPRPLKIGFSDGRGNVQVLSGLKAGDQIVTSGEFLIDAESRTQEAIQKLIAARQAKREPMPAAPMAPEAAVAPVDQKQVDAIAVDYLTIAKALGQKQITDQTIDVDPLLAHAQAMNNIAIVAATKAMINVPIDEQRKQFPTLSAAVIHLVEQTPPSTTAAKSLVIFRCTMTNASWIQDNDVVMNPFFATIMKECGEITKRIELKSK